MDFLQIILSVALVLSEGLCLEASNETSEGYFSCQDQCDNSIHLPCSCHHKCLVYRNCCEDYSHFCPQQSQNASQQFGFLLGRSISCSVEGFFMIDSCPDEGDATVDGFVTTMSTRLWLFLKSMNALPSNVFSDSSTTAFPFFDYDQILRPTPPYESEIVDFKTIWKDRPVFDNFTGFLFSDYDKYVCNAVPNSLPVFWEIQLGLESLKMFEQVDVFETLVNWTSVRYQQPRSVGSVPVGVQCIPISLRTCPDIVKYTDPETYKLCINYTNYVKDSRSGLIFNNKDCSNCFNRKRRILDLVEDFTSPKLTSVFSILIAMSQNNVVIKALEEKSQEPATWKEINCGLGPEQNVETERIRCEMKECADNAVRTLNDTCVDGKYVTLALGHAGFPLDSHVKIMLKEFLHCWITPQFGYDAIDARDIDLLPVTYYDNIINETLDVITVAVTSRDPSTSLSRPEHIQSLDYLNKALTFYRMDRDVPSGSHNVPDQRGRHIRQILQNDAKLKRFLNSSMAYDTFSEPSSSSTLNLKQSQLLKTENPALYYSIFPEENPVVVENVFYTTCICENTRNQSCAMVCWQTPLFRGDIDSIVHFLESQCFEMFESSASDCRLVPTVPILWTVLCFILRYLRL